MTARQDTESKLIAKAVKDPGFRQTLISDPHKALADEIGAVPEGISIKVVEETPKQLYIVLPPAPAADGSLPDEQLAGVAGGAGSKHTSCAWGITCATGSVIGNC